MVTMITYLRIIKNFEGAEEDSDSVAKTNFPGILTCNGLIFVGKESNTPRNPRKFIHLKNLYAYGIIVHNLLANDGDPF